MPYGAGASRVALMTGMELDEAQAFIDTFFETFCVLKRWLDEQGVQAVLPLNQGALGYSTTPALGRKRFYQLPENPGPDIDKLKSQIKRWAGNMPIQGASADILKVALKKLYLGLRGGSFVAKPIYDARLLLVVHDEVVMLCRTDQVSAVKAIMGAAMNEAYYEYTPRVGDPRHVYLGAVKDPETGVVVDKGIQVVDADIWSKA